MIRALFLPSLRSAAVLLAAALLLSCSADEPEKATPTVSLGSPLPALQLLAVNGEIRDSKSAFSDKVVVFNLWATWCPPCRREMPDLIRLSELLPSDKFVVAGLSIDNSLEDVQRYISEMDIPFPMYWDVGGQRIAAPIFKAFRYPETFVFNRQGVLVEKVTGMSLWASPERVSILESIYQTGRLPPPAQKRPG